MKFDLATLGSNPLLRSSTRAASDVGMSQRAALQPPADDPTRRLCLCTAGAMFGMTLAGWLASPWIGQTGSLTGFALVGGVYALLAVSTRRQQGDAPSGNTRRPVRADSIVYAGRRQGSLPIHEAIPPRLSSSLHREI